MYLPATLATTKLFHTHGDQNRPNVGFGLRGNIHVRPNLEAALREFRHASHGASNELKPIPVFPVSKPVSKDPGYLVIEEVLEQGAPPGTPRRLWIDAICINQEDFSERNQQIRLMCSIYSRCKRLLVWFGSEDEQSDLAMDFLNYFVVYDENWDEGGSAFRAWAKVILDSPFLHIILASVDGLLGRPWFTRTWVLQESSLGGDYKTVYQCGRKYTSNIAMAMVASRHDQLYALVMERHHPVAARLSNTARFKQLYETRNGANRNATGPEKTRWKWLEDRYSRTVTANLLFWLGTNRHSLAIDPRDKVFAVLGIVEQMMGEPELVRYTYEPLLLKIDYGASIQDVYSSVVKAVVVATGRLDILGSCSETGKLVNRSWTPDWTVRGQRSFINGDPCAPEHEPTGFSAAGATPCIVKFDDPSKITVRGFSWDRIDVVVSEEEEGYPVAPGPIQPSAMFKQKCEEIVGMLIAKGAYESERTARRNFWHTLCMTPANSRRQRMFGFRDSPPKYPQIVDSQFSWSNRRVLQSFRQLPLAQRSVVLTEKGYIGETAYPRRVRKGDVVCVFFGCPAPIVLRPVDACYLVIGDIYLGGIMYGKAMKGLDEEKARLQDFELI